ncbi:hypothetical protein [Pseudomonas lactucae]|nr:hypothetical protein [Pseudomonas lactucae]
MELGLVSERLNPLGFGMRISGGIDAATGLFMGILQHYEFTHR